MTFSAASAALAAPTPGGRICTKTVQGLLGLFDDQASGQAFLRDLMATFESSGEETLAGLAGALAAEDAGRMGKYAHKLKGLGRNIGATRLGDLCHVLETAMSGAQHAEPLAGRAAAPQAVAQTTRAASGAAGTTDVGPTADTSALCAAIRDEFAAVCVQLRADYGSEG